MKKIFYRIDKVTRKKEKLGEGRLGVDAVYGLIASTYKEPIKLINLLEKGKIDKIETGFAYYTVEIKN